MRSPCFVALAGVPEGPVDVDVADGCLVADVLSLLVMPAQCDPGA